MTPLPLGPLTVAGFGAPARVLVTWCPKCGQPGVAVVDLEPGPNCSLCDGYVEIRTATYRLELVRPDEAGADELVFDTLPPDGLGTRIANVLRALDLPKETTWEDLAGRISCKDLRRRRGYGRRSHVLLLAMLEARGLKLRCGCSVPGECRE